jgi:hypothetical protein
MKKISLVLIAMSLNACSTGPTVKMIEQSDSKPSWASLTKSTYQDGDKMRFVGYFTAEGDSRPSAVIHGSGTKATAMPLQAMSDDFLQQSGIAEDMRESSAKLVISTLRKNPPTIPGLQVTGSYYERVEIQGSDGVPRTEIRGYSLAECSVSEYNQAKHDALERLKGDPKIKQELDSIMAQQRDRSFDNNRKPASVAPSASQPKPVTLNSDSSN